MIGEKNKIILKGGLFICGILLSYFTVAAMIGALTYNIVTLFLFDTMLANLTAGGINIGFLLSTLNYEINPVKLIKEVYSNAQKEISSLNRINQVQTKVPMIKNQVQTTAPMINKEQQINDATNNTQQVAIPEHYITILKLNANAENIPKTIFQNIKGQYGEEICIKCIEYYNTNNTKFNIQINPNSTKFELIHVS